MACGAKAICKHAFRKAGKNTVHCSEQAKNGGQWDFCAHQYFCGRTNQWELSREANDCPLVSTGIAVTLKKAEKPEAKKATQKKSKTTSKKVTEDAEH